MVTEEMIRRLPKVELHDHLDGGVRPQTIVELAKKYHIEIPEKKSGDLANWFHRGADRKNLGLYLEGFRTTLSVMQTEEALERIARESLEDLAEESEAARAALERQLTYQLFLQQAQNETAKAILSLTLDDIGQARREISTLRASLVSAAEVARESDVDTLIDLETRASRAETDLSTNTFASQQTLEVIWRDLDELTGAQAATQ